MPNRRTVLFLLAVCVCAPVRGDVHHAVVRIGGCSGVCIDPAGLVLSTKHCDHPETVTVEFPGRTAVARRVYVAPETEGPVVFDCEGEGYPFASVASTVPVAGSRVWSLGYPGTPAGRALQRGEGLLLRGGTFKFRGGAFRGNVVGFPTGGGWSGGPLFNDQGQVIGILSSSDCLTSVFVSFGAVRRAYDAVREAARRKPSLLVFGSGSCGPCRQFKADYAADATFRAELEAAFELTWIDVDRQPEVARQHGVTEVPAFLATGRQAVVGYESKARLLEQLGLTGRDAPQQSETTPVAPAATDQPAVETPETPPPEPPQAPPMLNPGGTDAVDRALGVARAATTVATWLGITGATGGLGGLVLGGIALVRSLRNRRRRGSAARAPPANPPAVVALDSPPPPQAIVPETRFAPYERDTFAEAFAWAEIELVRKYPGAVGTLEALKGLIDQFLSAKGLRIRDAQVKS